MNLKSKSVKVLTTLLIGASFVGLAQTTQPTLEELFLGSVQVTNAFAVESARLALQKPSSAAVKGLAQTLANDHLKAQQSVRGFFDLLYAGGGKLGPSSSGDNRPNPATPTTAPSSSSAATNSSGGGNTTQASGGNALSETPSAEQTLGGGSPSSNNPNTARTPTSATTRTEGTNTAQKGSSLPSMIEMLAYDQQLKLRVLGAQNGAAFNSAFAIEQVAAHESAIRNVRFAAQKLSTPQMKTFAQQTLAVLEKNLRTARALPR